MIRNTADNDAVHDGLRPDRGPRADSANVNPPLAGAASSELEDHHALQLLKAAEQRARQQEGDECDTGETQAALEDLRFLRQALDKYDVLERVQHGGQGVVYKAQQRGANRIVALKLLLDGPLAGDRQRFRFDREVELISRLRHPNIVTLYDSGSVRGRPFFAMEFVEGLPIDDFVILNDLRPTDITALMIKVCRAVNYAHQNGVIHRDLNPANILVDSEGQPHIFDFGLAKDEWSSDEEHRFSLTGQIIGTLPYLSPEQAGGFDGAADVRSDVYALGVILYELLTEVFPYTVSGKPHAVRNAIISSEPVPLRKALKLSHPDRAPDLEAVNRDLEAILSKALSKSKDERYQSAAELADDLARYQSGEAVSVRAGSRFYYWRKALRRHRVAATIAFVVLASMGVSSIVVTASLFQVRAQRDVSEKTTSLALRAFETALTEIEESIRRLAGSLAVSQRFLTKLERQLQDLDDLIGSRERLVPLVARLRENQGDVARLQGNAALARRRYQDSLDMTLDSQGVAPESADPADDISRVYFKLAKVSQNPEPIYLRGIKFARSALARAQGSNDARFALAQLLVAYGVYLKDRADDYHNALDQLDGGLKLCPEFDALSSTELRWSRLAAVAFSAKGLIAREQGAGEDGISDILAGLDLRKRILQANPADAEARYALLFSYTHAALVKRDSGDRQRAIEFLEKAAEHGRLLAMLDPTATDWNRSRFVVHFNLSELYLNSGDVERAQAHCNQAVTLEERIKSVDPHSSNTATRHADILYLKGRLLIEAHAWEEARPMFEEAVSIREEHCQRKPQDLANSRRLADALHSMAYCSRNAHSTLAALAAYARAHTIYTRLSERRANVVQDVLGLIRVKIGLAAANMDLKTQEKNVEALRFLHDADDMLETLKRNERLIGREGEYDRLKNAISSNEDIIVSNSPIQSSY